ncbi:MAG: 50S ribosomal protein L16 [Candidatus Omnitrophota bacterium]
MALMPKRVKYRKSQRGCRKGLATRGANIDFGEFGLKALENCWIKNTQLEAARVILTKQLRGGGKLWIRAFPDKSVTKKPAETRQGKGKGELDHWVAVVKRGKILFELSGVPEEFAKNAFVLAAHKLPIRTKFVTRQH